MPLHWETPESWPRAVSTEREISGMERDTHKFEQAVRDYVKSGHAELVPKEDLKKSDEQTFYLPMHRVSQLLLS